MILKFAVKRELLFLDSENVPRQCLLPKTETYFAFLHINFYYFLLKQDSLNETYFFIYYYVCIFAIKSELCLMLMKLNSVIKLNM